MKIAYVLYPDFTGLDLVGPYEVISRWPDAEVHFVARTLEPVRADRGLTVIPTDTPEMLPNPELIVVPGSENPLPVLDDHVLVEGMEDLSDVDIRADHVARFEARDLAVDVVGASLSRKRDHRVPDHEAGRVRAQPDHGCGGLLGGPHPPDRLLRDHCFAALGVPPLKRCIISVSMIPGQMAFTRMLAAA